MPSRPRPRTYGLLGGIATVIGLAAFELTGLALVVALVVFVAWAVPEIDPSRNRTGAAERSDDGPDLGPPVI